MDYQREPGNAPIADIAADTAREAALDAMSRNWHEARREARVPT